MREAAIFTNEAEFRAWFEGRLERFGVSRIILSQEVCPDYVLEMRDGSIIRAEAEPFAINFRYHGHDPRKVDLIIACYAKTRDVAGVPVLAANELWSEDIEPLDPLSPNGPLSETEEIILTIAHSGGGMEVPQSPRTQPVPRSVAKKLYSCGCHRTQFDLYREDESPTA